MNLLLLGQINPLQVIDFSDYKGSEARYKTTIHCTGNREWYTTKTQSQVRSEYNALLNAIHKPAPNVTSEIDTLRQFLESDKSYLTRFERRALTSLLEKLS